jgi:hypothetical protein
MEALDRGNRADFGTGGGQRLKPCLDASANSAISPPRWRLTCSSRLSACRNKVSSEHDARAVARRSFGNLMQAEERFYESHPLARVGPLLAGRTLRLPHVAQVSQLHRIGCSHPRPGHRCGQEMVVWAMSPVDKAAIVSHPFPRCPCRAHPTRESFCLYRAAIARRPAATRVGLPNLVRHPIEIGIPP